MLDIVAGMGDEAGCTIPALFMAGGYCTRNNGTEASRKGWEYCREGPDWLCLIGCLPVPHAGPGARKVIRAHQPVPILPRSDANHPCACLTQPHVSVLTSLALSAPFVLCAYTDTTALLYRNPGRA